MGWGQDREGSLLLTLGAEGGPDPDKREQKDSDNADTSRFNKPADVSVDPVSGTVFVADGYGNSRVVAFDPSGGCATVSAETAAQRPRNGSARRQVPPDLWRRVRLRSGPDQLRSQLRLRRGQARGLRSEQLSLPRL